MAKARKRSTSNRKAARKRDQVEKNPLISKAAKQDIAAILIVGLSVLLIVAFFGGAGSLGISFLSGLKTLIGLAVYPLPFALLLLSYALFRVSKYELKANNYFGLIGFFIILAGMLQFTLAAESTVLSALPAQGGFIGYGIWLLVNPLLTKPLALFMLGLIELIVIIVATNVRLVDLARKLTGRMGTSEGESSVQKPGFKIRNNALPIRGTVGGEDPKPKLVPKSAITSSFDKDWKYPPLDLLKGMSTKPDAGNEKEKAAIIEDTLKQFGIEVTMTGVSVGPTVGQYTLKPASGVKLNKITSLDRNLALALKANQVRIEAPIPGTDEVGIEVPNDKIAMVRLRDILEDKDYAKKPSKLEFVLGRDVSGSIVSADLASMPHLLIAGQTGAGKSATVNTLLMSLLYRNSPAELKMILVDPKRVEMGLYNDIPHLLTPVIFEPEKAISGLKWAVTEMDRRLKLLQDNAKRNIAEYNAQKGVDGMPYIVIIVDEFFDLMMVAGKDVEALIMRLTQMARAVGIHVVLATQRPSVNVITGTIKANVPARIALSTASQVDSRTIIDQAGADKLLGRGDMLFSSPEFMKPLRAQGVWVSEEEVKEVTQFLRDEREPHYNEEVLAQSVSVGSRGGVFGDAGSGDDQLYDEVVAFVAQTGKASASLLQRHFKVGYSRAARLMDLMEENNVVGPQDGAKPRAVLISSADLEGASGGMAVEPAYLNGEEASTDE